MESARRVCGEEACLIYLSHPRAALEGLGEWVGLWKVFHILSPFFVTMMPGDRMPEDTHRE
jgi:hypothetical protein